MKKLWMIPLLVSALSANAQIFEKTAINLGYRYAGRNVLQAGLALHYLIFSFSIPDMLFPYIKTNILKE